ncbi:hypothetical protein NW765_007346 [Fusarium oxysporum]|nr:hypothetical protein NW765_007346 [Fusarium oxysporum]
MTRQVPLKQPFWTATFELLHDSLISLIQDDGMTTVAHYGDKKNALSKVSMNVNEDLPAQNAIMDIVSTEALETNLLHHHQATQQKRTRHGSTWL